MNTWHSYPELPNGTDHDFDIIKALYSGKDYFFSLPTETEQTQFIKSVLKNLGHSKDFKVYANRQLLDDSDTVPFVNKEWHYDIHWYTDKDYIFPISLPLVAECEWRYHMEKAVKDGEYYREDGKKLPYSAVRYDFQKLLVSNADLRLMIFKVRHQEDLNLMKDYFDEAIRSYQKLNYTDKFLIVAYQESIKQIYFIQTQK